MSSSPESYGSWGRLGHGPLLRELLGEREAARSWGRWISPMEADRCREGCGPAGGNYVLQRVKSSSRLFRNYVCRRQMCFRCRGPLRILISFSGAAVIVTFLNSRACSHQMYSLIPSTLCQVDFYKLLIQQTQASWW